MPGFIKQEVFPLFPVTRIFVLISRSIMAKFIAVATATLLCQLCFASAISGTANFFEAVTVFAECKTSATEGTVYAGKADASLWNNGAACGKIYCVVCTGAKDQSQPSPCQGKSSIYVQMLASCPNCGATISISQEGFNAIADGNSGTISINYSDNVQDTKLPCA